jgi:hypothetical protein
MRAVRRFCIPERVPAGPARTATGRVRLQAGAGASDPRRRFRQSPQPKVVFCQNPYYAHRGLREARCYREFGVDELIVAGRAVYDFCNRRFPALRVSVIPVMVDTEVFKVQSEKRLQIAYSPRKRPLEAAIIQDLFWSLHPEFQSIPWVPIADQTEAVVAQNLSESAVFLSLCRLEGCPLSILEAFASGCLVAGFLGWGGRDYASGCNGYWAKEDDCMDCAEQLGRAVTTVTSNNSLYTEIVSLAHSDARRYGLKRFEDRLLGFWKGYLSRHFA